MNQNLDDEFKRAADLLPENRNHWGYLHKAQVAEIIVNADKKLRRFLILEASKKYDASFVEIKSWVDRFRKYGPKGLQATQAKQYRDASSRSAKCDYL